MEHPRNIAVVGSGVIGLSAAVRLASSGRVTVFSRDDLAGTTSSRAGAVFSAFDAADLTALLTRSARAFADLALDRSTGVTLRPSSEFWASPASIPEWTTAVAEALATSVQPLSRIGPYSGGFRLTLPHIDITRYMPWLRERALESGATIVKRDVQAVGGLFDEGFDLVINASGLGARALASDPAVMPMRGQVVHVPNDLDLTEAIDATEPDGAITYIYPFENHVVLGGTYEVGQRVCATDPAALDAITDRCRALLAITGHARAQELGRTRLREIAGLRPARVIGERREAVRIELERTDRGPVIHAYGHGRAGITLSWGTAAHVVQLVDQIPTMV